MVKWGAKKVCGKNKHRNQTPHTLQNKAYTQRFSYLGYIQALTTSIVIQCQYSEMHTNKAQD